MAHALVLGALLSLALVPAPPAPLATIPFELINKHIYVPVKVNGSRPLSFVLDTGASAAMIDIDRAKELSLRLEGEIGVGGAGAKRLKGAFVKDASWTLAGLEGFSEPVKVAAPLAHMAPFSGRDFDGILGEDFIEEYVVEIDYAASVLRLHEKKGFVYQGPGAAVPIVRRHGHPVLEAEVTPVGGTPIKGKFVVDVGAGSPLALHSPFVKQHALLRADLPTIRTMGAGGAGGGVSARTGRVAALTIGPYTLKSPLTLFTQDESGAFAEADLQGNIGQPLLSRFKLFLDYGRDRIIFEPTASLAEPFDRAFSGLAFEAQGKDYATFRVRDVLEHSPASEAGIRVDDVVTRVDDRAIAQTSLSELLEMLEKPVARKLTIRRGNDVRTVVLTPRRLV
ncbi:MAG TPA: retropepsin-like aspartic protease [Thermoanaerobaculia bacterium]|jgi:hypothetical protein